MNRKQRVLTVIALIAFVVIGACHYLRLETYQSGPGKWRQEPQRISKTWSQMTADERQQVNEYEDALLEKYLKAHPANPNAKQIISVDPDDPRLDGSTRSFSVTSKVWVERDLKYSQRLALTDPKGALVTDVRMPSFMLGVIFGPEDCRDSMRVLLCY